MSLGASYLSSAGVPTTGFDPATANAMLDAAGDTRATKCGTAPDGQDFRAAKDGTCIVVNLGTTSDDPVRVTVESMIRADLAKIGINVPAAFEPNVPAATFFGAFADGGPLATHAFDMALYTVGSAFPVSPTPTRRPGTVTAAAPVRTRTAIPSSANLGVGMNFSGLNDAQLDSDLDQARTSADLTARAQRLRARRSAPRHPAARDPAVPASHRQHLLVEPARRRAERFRP